mmetsp:Transcript_13147/g.15331  ORF Transcript_13147/g.15331 Transcript_13147/m.15331 type:complete len:602 (+) Transcript_13147:291-2096(+)
MVDSLMPELFTPDVLDEQYDDEFLFLPYENANKFGNTAPVQLSMKQVFTILINAMKGELDPNIPVRPQASPIHPDISCFYVRKGSTSTAKIKKRKLAPDSQALISVKYQGFNPLNCEVWWSPQHQSLLGIISRPMSKQSRKTKLESEHNDSNRKKNRVHGFTGYLFSLVRRSEADRDSGIGFANFKSLLVKDSYSLVQFWKVSGRSMHDDKSIISSGSSTTFPTTSSDASYLANEDHGETIRNSLRIEGDLYVAGDTTVRNLHVLGNLLVEGNISGQLVTPPGAADYAEWFPILNPSERIQPGMVIQLRSPQQKITLDTSGSGPHMVVSTTPSVAAGVPPTVGDAEPVPGALCAFMGQVPVKVIGPVQSGELLFPSCENDGYAVVAGFKEYSGETVNEPIGTAMTSCGEGKHTVLAFIRWQHSLDYYSKRSANSQMYKTEPYIWIVSAFSFAEKALLIGYFYVRPHLLFEMFLAILSFIGLVHAVLRNHIQGKYSEFVLHGHVLLYILLSIMRISCSFWTLCLFAATGTPELLPSCFMGQLIILIEVVFIYVSMLMIRQDFWETKYKMRTQYRPKMPLWRAYDFLFGHISLAVKCGNPKSD